MIEFTSRGICRLFPEVTAVLERGETSGFPSARLPQNCRLWPVSKELLADPVELIRAALDSFSSGCNYVFLCEADIFVAQWELRASLLKCLQYDIVRPGEEPVQLTLEETQKALKSSGEKVDTRFYPRHSSFSPLPGFVIVSRRALEDSKSRSECDDNGLPTERVFRCPSRTLRLCTGG